MKQLLVSFLPIVLTLYFIFRSFKDPVFLLGIPFLIFFRHSIFFERFKLFNTPADWKVDTLFLVWLILVWLILSNRALLQIGYRRINYYVSKKLNWLDVCCFGLILISVVDLFIVLNHYTNQKDIFNEFYAIVSLPLGYFIIKNIIRYVDPVTLHKFLFSIVLVNTIASTLYLIHQGFHIELYLSEGMEEQEAELFQGETITRTFWFMPLLWFFSVAYLVIFRKENLLLHLGMLGVNILAIFISYTRSFLMVAAVIILIYFMLVGIKSG